MGYRFKVEGLVVDVGAFIAGGCCQHGFDEMLMVDLYVHVCLSDRFLGHHHAAFLERIDHIKLFELADLHTLVYLEVHALHNEFVVISFFDVVTVGEGRGDGELFPCVVGCQMLQFFQQPHHPVPSIVEHLLLLLAVVFPRQRFAELDEGEDVSELAPFKIGLDQPLSVVLVIELGETAFLLLVDGFQFFTVLGDLVVELV